MRLIWQIHLVVYGYARAWVFVSMNVLNEYLCECTRTRALLHNNSLANTFNKLSGPNMHIYFCLHRIFTRM